jgi:predicted small lipoprotein YifL
MSPRRARGWIVACGALLSCAGCGFKGPLYLPERNVTVVTHPARGQTQAPAAKKKEQTAPPAAAPAGAPAPPPQ